MRPAIQGAQGYPTWTLKSSAAMYEARYVHRRDSENWLHLRQHQSLQQILSIGRFETISHDGQCTWAWRDPQQSVETSPWGHTEDPKRYPTQDMNLSGFSSSVEISKGNPNPQPELGLYWPIQLQTQCSDLLAMQGSGVLDHYSPHLLSWKIPDIRQKPVWLQETL